MTQWKQNGGELKMLLLINEIGIDAAKPILKDGIFLNFSGLEAQEAMQVVFQPVNFCKRHS